jgi:hypothetical protein
MTRLVEELAERLWLRPTTVHKRIYSDQLSPVRPTGQAVRVREDAVEVLARVGYKPGRGGRARE